MRSAADEIGRVSSRLRSQFNVDPGLEDAIRMYGVGTAADLAAVQDAVGARIRALQAAWDELRQLLSTLAGLSALARFTPEGWPERRAELNAAFTADAMTGLARWTDEWCLAAAELRTEPLERLTAEPFGYPPGSQVLPWRFGTAQRALAKRNWRLVRPVLRAAADGLRIADRDVPTPEVRAALWLLLARIAVQLGEDPSAYLEAAQGLGASAADAALVRAWSARLTGNYAEAAACLASARAEGSSVGIIAELVRQARESTVEVTLSAAKDRLAGLGSIVDISGQLDRLIEPAPPELWLAVAERAAAEQDHDLAATAFDNAERGVGSQFALGAVIHERRAEQLAASHGDQAATADAWLTAGDDRWSAGQPDIAQQHYRAAQALRPDDLRAAMGQLCAEAAEWSAKPISESAPHLTDLLGKLESLQAAHGVEPAMSWSLLNAASIRTQLAAAGDDSVADHTWGALLAIGRALVFDPRAASTWNQLAEALGTFSIYQTAVFAARRAFSLEPAQQQRYELIRASINLGDLDAGRDLLSEGVDRDLPWIKAADGFIQCRIGSKEKATELLRDAARQDPSMLWARELLMRAYLLTGETEVARREARQLRAYLGDRRDLDSLISLAECALISGDFAEAERLGLRLVERESRSTEKGDGLRVLGQAKLLSGQADGVDDVGQAAAQARVPRVLDDWERLELPLMHILAADHGIELPDLTPVAEASVRRRATLAAWADPLAELADTPSGTADQVVTNQARTMLSVLLREASADPAGTQAALDAGAPMAAGVPEWLRLAERVRRAFVADCLSRGDLDQAMAAEQGRLADPVHSKSDGRLAEIAEMLSVAGRHDDAKCAVDAARERVGSTPELTRTDGDLLWRRGLRAEAAKAWETAQAAGADRVAARLAARTADTDRSAAAGLLHDAIARSYIDTATDLHALLTEPTDIAAVIAALGDAGSDADTEPGARAAIRVLQALPGQLQLPENGLEVHLPPSWFAGAKDPVNDFPLLARYIPEARLRLPWTLPGIQARDDVSLEPDGYRILILGEFAEQGNVPPQNDYVIADAVPLLSAAAQARVTQQRVLDTVAVQHPDEPATGLDVLLLMPATELVGLRIEAVATVFSTALQQFWSHKSGT